jgi:hypothetical protein
MKRSNDAKRSILIAKNYNSQSMHEILVKCSPLSHHADEDSQKRNQKAAMLSRHSNRRALDLSMRPIRPETQFDIVIVRGCHIRRPEFWHVPL